MGLLRYIAYCFALGCLLIIASCSNTKYLGEGEVMHNKVSIDLNSKDEISHPRELKFDLERVSRPSPNKRWAGLKLSLWFWNRGDENGKGVRKWMKERWGEPAVLMDSTLYESSCRLMETWLFNHGYYHANVDYAVKVKRRRAKLKYSVSISKQYQIRDISFPADSTAVGRIISETSDRTLLKPGVAFNVDLMQEERVRITEELNNRGYFDFRKESISFSLDSFQLAKEVDIFVQFANKDSGQKHELSFLGDIYLSDDYFPGDQRYKTNDTTFVNGIRIISSRHQFREDLLSKQVKFSAGEKYSNEKRRATLNNFLQLGVFKFVNIKYEQATRDTSVNVIDVFIYLTPGKKMSYSIENEWNSRSSDFIANDQVLGTALTGTYENKNTFRGAERLTFSVYSGVELDLNRNGEQPLVRTINGNASLNLRIPRFVLPVPKKILSPKMLNWLSETKVKTNIGSTYYYRREIGGEGQSSFTLTGIDFGFGYDWQRNNVHRHVVTPLNLTYTEVLNTNDVFDVLLDENVGFARSLENKFIPGGNYTYLYSNRQKNPFANRYNSFRTKVEFAGNLISGIEGALEGLGIVENDVESFLGFPYAQYVRLETDYRYYWNPRRKTQVAFRAYGGIGYAYGKSGQFLPYIRQFYSGGSNGIRAFVIRGIGPGSFRPEAGDPDSQYDRTGDFKLEANLEYRFPIYSYFKGAFFIDAGNIWNLRDGSGLEGGTFDPKDFASEIAIGSGFGLRVDFSYFIIRFDAAIPLKKPYLDSGSRWVADEIDFFSGQWRSDNIVLQIGIGYPF